MVSLRFLHLRHRLKPGKAGPEKEPVGPLNLRQILLGKPPASQTDAVDSLIFQRFFRRQNEGWHILDNPKPAADETMLSHMTKLVYQHTAAQGSPVFHQHMSAQGNEIGENNGIPDLTIVGYMNAGHEQHIVSDFRLAVGRRSPIDRNIFPDGHAIADQGLGRFPGVFQILGHLADGAILIETAILADGGSRAYGHVGTDHRSRSDGDAVFNNGKRTDGNLIPQMYRRSDKGGGMN